jgi:hypothetical protein
MVYNSDRLQYVSYKLDSNNNAACQTVFYNQSDLIEP